MPVAIVTGASRGFGHAVAADLAKSGWDLIIDGRRSGPLTDKAEALSALGVEVRAFAGDITDPSHRDALVEAAGAWGRLDLVVNNASTLGPSPLPKLAQYPLRALARVYEVNVLAPLALVQRALPLLRRSRGTVVAISSDAAVAAYEGWGGYGSSKAALDQLHHVLAIEEPRLRVYRFDPGDMRTAMHQDAFPGIDISDRPEPESVVPALRLLLESAPPSGRYGAGEWMES
ncbi:MAG TPA: SDR family oxidoreductase [Acidimicrobiales bacterium]|nr:SDR family oxidoreductase [Acidimicrobiales bacterium]